MAVNNQTKRLIYKKACYKKAIKTYEYVKNYIAQL